MKYTFKKKKIKYSKMYNRMTMEMVIHKVYIKY